jgi:hypothetical protein
MPEARGISREQVIEELTVIYQILFAAAIKIPP